MFMPDHKHRVYNLWILNFARYSASRITVTLCDAENPQTHNVTERYNRRTVNKTLSDRGSIFTGHNLKSEDFGYGYIRCEWAAISQSVQRLATGLDSPGFESLWGARFSAPVQTGPGVHPTSYIVGTGSFPGVKRPGRGVDHPPPSIAEVKESTEL